MKDMQYKMYTISQKQETSNHYTELQIINFTKSEFKLQNTRPLETGQNTGHEITKKTLSHASKRMSTLEKLYSGEKNSVEQGYKFKI